MSGTVKDFLLSEGISTMPFSAILNKSFLYLVHCTLKEMRNIIPGVEVNSLLYILERACQITLESGDFRLIKCDALAMEYDVPLSLGCRKLDQLFKNEWGDGITSTAGIVEVFGEAGSGKTQFCLQLLLQAQLPQRMGGYNGESLYLTSELFPRKRLSQLVDGMRQKGHVAHNPEDAEFLKTHPFLDNTYVESFSSFQEQEDVLLHKLPTLLLRMDVKVVVVDSMASLFRIEYDSSELVAKSNELFKLAQNLKRIASVFQIPIIVTNQVSARMTQEDGILTVNERQQQISPALGLSWSNCVNTRVKLSRKAGINSSLGTGELSSANVLSPIERIAEIEFSNQWEANKSVSFYINDNGIHGL